MGRTKIGLVRPQTRPSPKSVKDLRDFDVFELDEYLHKEDERLQSRRVERKK